MGTDALAVAREFHGGLLSLLEKHPACFSVERVPKNDAVTLVADKASLLSLELDDFKSTVFRSHHGESSEGWSSVAVPSRCLHVGNVAGSMTEDKLRQQFGHYGKIEALKCATLGVPLAATATVRVTLDASCCAAGLCRRRGVALPSSTSCQLRTRSMRSTCCQSCTCGGATFPLQRCVSLRRAHLHRHSARDAGRCVAARDHRGPR
jgi:hypothetical protein